MVGRTFLLSSYIFVVALTLALSVTEAFPLSPLSSVQNQYRGVHVTSQIGTQANSTSSVCYSTRKRKKFHSCEELTENDDFDLDRREAAFAMLGALWSMGGLAIPAAASPRQKQRLRHVDKTPTSRYQT